MLPIESQTHIDDPIRDLTASLKLYEFRKNIVSTGLIRNTDVKMYAVKSPGRNYMNYK